MKLKGQDRVDRLKDFQEFDKKVVNLSEGPKVIPFITNRLLG